MPKRPKPPDALDPLRLLPSFTRERGGWCRWDLPDLPDVTVRTLSRVVGDRPIITEVRITGDDMYGDQLARIPLRLMASTLLQEHVGRALAADKDFARNLDVGREYLRGDRPLGRPSRAGEDDFYRKVAGVYLALSTTTGKPSHFIAQVEDVPITTVRRWIVEARRRKFLPSGRKGVAG